MKIKILLGVLGVLTLAVVGCVNTVSGGKAAGVPFVKDTVEGRYERSVEAVFKAAREVILDTGTLSTESVVHNSETNEVKTIVAKVSQRTVYIRVSPVDAQTTSVAVQTRTQGGGTDLDLAHELEKRIALKLVH